VFLLFVDSGGCHRRRGREEGMRPLQVSPSTEFLAVARELMRRHCLAAPEVCLTLF